MTVTDPVAVVLPASVVTVRVATDVVRRVARRVVLLPANLLLSSVVDSVVAVVLLLRHRASLSFETAVTG